MQAQGPGFSWISKQRLNTSITSNMQQMEILLVILSLSRKKFLAKQTVLLSSSMKLGPGSPSDPEPPSTEKGRTFLNSPGFYNTVLRFTDNVLYYQKLISGLG